MDDDGDNPAFDRIVGHMTVNRLRNASLDRSMKAMIRLADITPQQVAKALGVHAHYTAFSSYDDTIVLVAKAQKLIALVEARWSGFPMSIELCAALDRLAVEMASLTMPSYDAEAIAQIDFSTLKPPKTEI